MFGVMPAPKTSLQFLSESYPLSALNLPAKAMPVFLIFFSSEAKTVVSAILLDVMRQECMTCRPQYRGHVPFQVFLLTLCLLLCLFLAFFCTLSYLSVATPLLSDASVRSETSNPARHDAAVTATMSSSHATGIFCMNLAMVL